MPASKLITDGKTLKALRKKRGMTQEALARAMQLEVRTIQRWEADDVKPSIQNVHQLIEQLNKTDWQKHPIHKMILAQDGAVALLDSFAVYRQVNSRFRSLYSTWEKQDIEGEYAANLFQFWHKSIEQVSDIAPQALASSNITSIDHCMSETFGGESIPLRHQVFVIRQEKFSTMLVHEISRISVQECMNSKLVITRRTAS
ncbi:MAG: helix-turn-helix transcriptional regulator [Rhizobiaceae bacterium]